MKKKLYIKKNIILIFLLTIIFSLIIFLIKNYFFVDENKEAEEKYIEYSSHEKKETIIQKESENNLIKEEGEKKNILDNKLEKKDKIEFLYIPEDFALEINWTTILISDILRPKIFNEKINNLKVELYKDLIDSRWQMKDESVKLYWIKKMDDDELTSVFIHEFSHYIDIYFLKKEVFDDISYYFYDISWDSTKVITSWQKQEDFVSWYAMTNKYEDFAETMTYYVLHNFSFAEKSKNSIYLKAKYDFFSKYVFRKNEFKNMDFWTTTEIKNYYRDITKIKINITNFLQYLLNEI